MSEDKTELIPDSRSFEERVFARFDAMDARFDAMDARFDAMDARFDAMDARFDAVDARFDAVESRLDAVERRLDRLDLRVQKLEEDSERRSLETKPIWERALAQIEELQKGLNELRDEVRDGFRDISRKFAVVANDLIQLRADHTHLDTRLSKLETKFQQ